MGESIKVKGIVLFQTNLNDNDKILTIFTDELGMIKAVAKGIRKYKKTGSVEMFYFSDIVISKGKNLYTINSSSLIESFYTLRTDIKKLALASYIAELNLFALPPEDPNKEALSLLLNMLFILSNGKAEADVVKAVYEFRFMSILGYEPHVDGCFLCGRHDNLDRFDLEGGFVCAEHPETPFMIPMRESIKKAIWYIISTEVSTCYSFKPSARTCYELNELAGEYVYFHLQKRFKSLEFYQNL